MISSIPKQPSSDIYRTALPSYHKKQRPIFDWTQCYWSLIACQTSQDNQNKQWHWQSPSTLFFTGPFLFSLTSSDFSLFLCTRTLIRRRSKLKNSSTKWQSPYRIVKLNRRTIIPLQDDMICSSVMIIWSDSRVFCLLICTPLSRFHSPRHDSRRLSLLMLVLSHSDAHYLSGVYGRVRVPRNLGSLFYYCPIIDHFPPDFISRVEDEGDRDFM